MDLAARKARLRAQMAERRRAIGQGEAMRAAQAVAELVESLPAFQDAEEVALYCALADELPSRPLFDRVRAAGKAALLPLIRDERIVFARVAGWEELVPGRYGVAEPPSGAMRVMPSELVIVPGVAFDRAGHRLGRGKGFYDRAFSGRGAQQLVGVGYAFQLVDEVPHGRDDRSMDMVVTDGGIWPAGERGKDA